MSVNSFVHLGAHGGRRGRGTAHNRHSLGMVSGSVKTRMVESIATPNPDAVPFQVLLLLTRSEIRDVEDQLAKRAGVIRTMTCSRDTSDLINTWSEDRPLVRMCTCGIRTTCRICARIGDDERGLSYRDEEAEAL